MRSVSDEEGAEEVERRARHVRWADFGLRWRLAVLAAVVAVVVSVVWPVLTSGRTSPREYWGTPLPAATEVSPSSDQIVRNLVRQYRTYYGSVEVTNQQYSIPIFVASRNQKLALVSPASGCSDFTANTGTLLPIPDRARPASGTDGALVVDQPSTTTEWELWQARRNQDGSWTACWGGKLSGRAALTGVFPSPFGLSASGISYLDTVISEADVRSGEIDHVLAMAIFECNGAVSPADRTDCATAPGEPSEGTWFRLPPGVHMPKGLTPFGRMVFRALQRYGAVVTDRSGGVSVGAEDSADWASQGHSGVDPITASFAGKPAYSALDGIPWSSLEVIEPPAWPPR